MVIVRNGITIELTADELFSAYREQEHIFDCEDVKNGLDSIVSADVDEEEYAAAAKRILGSASLIDACANDYRLNIDKYEMGWYDARELAVKDACCAEMSSVE